MPEQPAEFGVTHDAEKRPVPYISKPFPEWLDSELEAGLDQVARRIRRHPEFRGELERVERDLRVEQQRRRELYAEMAAVFLGPDGDQGGR